MKRKMTALVIGNAKYPSAFKLKNPANDATDFAKAIKVFGFSISKILNGDKKNIEQAIKQFKTKLNKCDVGLFFFSGHGMQIDGENYIAPIDIDASSEIDAKFSSYPLNKLIEIMHQSKNKTNIIILDACRDNPFEKKWSKGLNHKGLAPIYAPKGTIISFATSPGEIAIDQPKRNNGAFTEALLRHINTPDITIEELLKRTRNTLSVLTNEKQTSWEHTSLSGDFYFNLSAGKSIIEYGEQAISDEIFVIDKSKTGHDIIKCLKSRNWYSQNPAIVKLVKSNIEKCDNDTLFVIGRNIYQAACGNSIDAERYINSFRARTTDVTPEKRKAILDGMLFEIFFDPKGEIRDEFKMKKFKDVFDLIKYPEFSESFDFIAETLLLYQNRFYLIPGKVRNISVDIVFSSNSKNENTIESVFFDGTDILRKTDDYDDYFVSSNHKYANLKGTDIKDLLSEQMVIPINQLNFSPKIADFDSYYFPMGFTVIKGNTNKFRNIHSI